MAETPQQEGVVVRVDARQCEVDLAGLGSEPVSALLRGKLFEDAGDDKTPLAVGDRVQLTSMADGLAVEAVLPRRNLFHRRAAGEEVRRQPLAANVDQVVLVACFGTPPFSSILTDRILVSASFSEIPVTLVLNKTDRAKAGKIKKVVATYEQAGFSVILTSAKREEGIEQLTSCLTNSVSVFYGLSGVGKSSLLNCIQPGLGLKTREVSASLRSGRHTTTFARLWPLAAGGAVIDTPGVRVFRPWGIPPHELRLHYPEWHEAAQACRFPACLHREEPDCAILQLLQKEKLPASRHRSYLEILQELEEVYGGTTPDSTPTVEGN